MMSEALVCMVVSLCFFSLVRATLYPNEDTDNTDQMIVPVAVAVLISFLWLLVEIAKAVRTVT